MDTDWKTLRAELPGDIRARLDAKREERRLGNTLADVRKAMQPPNRRSPRAPA